LFELMREHLNQIRGDITMTPEENETLKTMYIQIKKLLADVYGLIEALPSSERASFTITKCPMPLHFVLGDKPNCFRMIDAPKFAKILPALSPNFSIKFSTQSDPFAMAETTAHGARAKSLSLNIGKIDNLFNLKIALQHELQHLLDWGTFLKSTSSGDKLDYLLHDGEVRAHAKEAAYVFSKLYGKEEFDLNKIKHINGRLSNYHAIASRPSAVVETLGVDSSYIPKLQNAGKDFILYSQYFLSLF